MSTATIKLRNDGMKAMAVSGKFKPTEILIASCFFDHVNARIYRETGAAQAWPSNETVAELCRVSVRAVQRFKAKAQKIGLLFRPGNNRGGRRGDGKGWTTRVQFVFKWIEDILRDLLRKLHGGEDFGLGQPIKRVPSEPVAPTDDDLAEVAASLKTGGGGFVYTPSPPEPEPVTPDDHLAVIAREMGLPPPAKAIDDKGDSCRATVTNPAVNHDTRVTQTVELPTYDQTLEPSSSFSTLPPRARDPEPGTPQPTPSARVLAKTPLPPPARAASLAHGLATRAGFFRKRADTSNIDALISEGMRPAADLPLYMRLDANGDLPPEDGEK